MSIALLGNSPAALTAGILLLSKARSYGQRFVVEVVGDPDDIAVVEGPALVHSPLLATCGLGREGGGLVVVPGPAQAPLALCLGLDGDGPWFAVDRSGKGLHPATQALVALSRDLSSRDAARALRRALAHIGLSSEPAVLDLLFGAPVPPLHRLALALRASRALGLRAERPPTLLVARSNPGDELLPTPLSPADFAAAEADGRLSALVDRLIPAARDQILGWAAEIAGAVIDPTPLLCALAELLSQLASLPRQGMLPALDPSMEAVAAGLAHGLAAQGPTTNGNQALVDTFRFLGGRFTDEARYPVEIGQGPPPTDRLGRWSWLSAAVRRSAGEAETLWRTVWDPPM